MACTQSDFAVLGDAELAAFSREGYAGAGDELVRRYVPLVNSCAGRYSGGGVDRDDLIQEGMLGLSKAIRGYNPLLNTPFAAFAASCVRNQLVSALRRASGPRVPPARLTVSLSDGIDRADDRLPDCAERLALGDYAERLAADLAQRLSALEKKVYGLRAEGRTPSDIAKNLDIPVKSVENALARIKRKASSIPK